MNKKTIFLSMGLVAVISGGWYGYSEYNRGVKKLESVKADLQMPANMLISAFEKDEQEANTIYLDKVIAVQGTVKAVEQDEKGDITIILGDLDDMSSVRCYMDSLFRQQAKGLIKGNLVTVKGACTGFNADDLLGSDVILNRCVIEKNNFNKQ